MSAETTSRKSKTLKWIGIVCGILLVLLIALYFTLTSAAFFKGVVLPRASEAAGATITVRDARISPFSSVALEGLVVQTTGDKPLLTARIAVADYSLMSILGGTIKVEDLAITDPEVFVEVQADGTSNLDPLMQERPEQEPAEPGEPSQLQIQKIALNNGKVTYLRHQPDGGQNFAELTALNLTIENLQNGETAKLNLNSKLRFAAGTVTNVSELTATLAAAFNVGLSPDLAPTGADGTADLKVTSASGAFADAADLHSRLVVDVTPQEVKQLALTFSKADQTLGTARVSGPFDLMKQEGKLKLDVSGIGNEALSLVGGRAGMSFGDTKLAATSELTIQRGGRVIDTTGTFTADTFSVKRNDLTTPVLDFRLAYDLTVNLPQTNAVVRTFTVKATQQDRAVLDAGLSRPMVLNWSRGAEAAEQSSFTAAINELNLSDWKAFLGPNIRSGVVNAKLAVDSQGAGHLIGFDLTANLTGLAAQFGSNRLDQAGVELAAQGQVTNFNQVNLAGFNARLRRAGQPVAALQGSGHVNATTRDANLRTDLDASLPGLSALLDRPDLHLTSGEIAFSGRMSQQNVTPNQTNNPTMNQSVVGQLVVTNLTGTVGSNRFDRFAAAANLDLAVQTNLARINRCVGALEQGGQSGGEFEVTGRYNYTNRVGDLALKIDDLNEHVLRSFVAAALAPRQLDSISISADTTAHYALGGDSTLQGNIQVADLLITDPEGSLPKVPLTAQANLDTTLSAQGVASIKQLNGRIRQGENAAGDFAITGRYDLTNRSGQIVLQLDDLNQHALRPFLAPALGEKKLESVSINANLNAHYDAQGQSAAKGTLSMTNLVVDDPSGTVPKSPLAATARLDASLAQQVLDLRELQVALAPTDRARNQAQLTGKVDMTKTNAMTGSLKLTAESLDVTPYYDLFMAGKEGQTNTAPETAKSESPPRTNDTGAAVLPEPPAKQLPFQQFTVDASVGQFYLREIVISNLVAKTTIDGGRIEVNPLELSLNGAPVSSVVKLNLGVPGYEYDVNAKAVEVPVAPLVNSLQPARKDQMGGTATAFVQMKGVGTTGASLQKHLTGQFDLGMTNLNMNVAQVDLPLVKTIIDVIIGLPDLIRNPGKTLLSAVGTITGSQESQGGWLDEITKSPLEIVSVQATAGNGQIVIQQAYAQSPAFLTDAQGTITLAPILTNSPMQIPVEVELRRDLAGKVGLIPANAPTNATYVKLPDFLTMRGTLGDPDPDLKIGVLLSVIGKAGLGIIGNTGEAVTDKVGGLLDAVRGLRGGTSDTNAPASTNAPPKKGGLLDIFRR